MLSNRNKCCIEIGSLIKLIWLGSSRTETSVVLKWNTGALSLFEKTGRTETSVVLKCNCACSVTKELIVEPKQVLYWNQ